MRKLFILLVSGVLAFVLMPNLVAQADDDDPKCYDTVVVKAAWTEVIEHPAVTHTVHHAAVPATPDLWWNWSPNKTQGPQDYTPAFPTDSRGTWQGPHQNGGPMQDTYGTFQTGGGNSPFFHREHGTAAVPAYDEVIVDKAAWTETVKHPAVTAQVEVPCDKNEPPVVDEPPVNGPKTPVAGPKEHHKPVKHGAPAPADQPVAVPTAVAAGL